MSDAPSSSAASKHHHPGEIVQGEFLHLETAEFVQTLPPDWKTKLYKVKGKGRPALVLCKLRDGLEYILLKCRSEARRDGTCVNGGDCIVKGKTTWFEGDTVHTLPACLVHEWEPCDSPALGPGNVLNEKVVHLLIKGAPVLRRDLVLQGYVKQCLLRGAMTSSGSERVQ